MEKKTIAQQLNIKDFPFIIKDKKGSIIYAELADNFWFKQELDEKGNREYFENSKGEIIDDRPKPIEEMTLEQVCKELGREIKIIK